MNNFALYSISSPLHKGLPDIRNEEFILDIQNEMGEDFIYQGEDFSSYGKYERNVIYVRTGGTEGIFKQLDLSGDIRLLTSGKNNSLAAAMEILAYVKMNGGSGEIIHGDASYISKRLKSCADISTTSKWLCEVPEVDFRGAKLGVIGQPSDWLIASGVDYASVREKFGLDLIDIDIAELISSVKTRDCDLKSFDGSVAIYDALKGIVAKYNLQGLTIRCFDLLDSIGNTGCLALARLNADGIVSSCEGDIPALISMMIAYKLTGCPGFQCNLSRIQSDELLFAHCTVPLSMVSSFSYMTHFESGIGTAIKGEIPEGDVTILKLSPCLDCMALIPAKLIRNQAEGGLCRTQIIVSAPGASEYFLTSPLANHHIVVPGILQKAF